jgi:hypothetical protein
MSRALQKFIGLCLAGTLVYPAIGSGQTTDGRLQTEPLLELRQPAGIHPFASQDRHVFRPAPRTANLPVDRTNHREFLGLQPIQQDEPANRYFGIHNSRPVVVLWFNSDLESQLLSPDQIKAWISDLPKRDFATAPNQLDRVQLASHWQQEDDTQDKKDSGKTKNTSDSEEKIVDEAYKDFQSRLKEVGELIEGRKQQFTDDKSLDEATRTELLNQISAANEKHQKAKLDFADLTNETQAEKEFETKLTKEQDKLAIEKKTAVTPVDPKIDSIEVLKEDLRGKESELQAAIDKQKQNRQDVTDRETRLADLPTLRNNVEKKLLQIEKEVDELKQIPDGPKRTLQSLLVKARKLSAEIQTELLSLEAKRQDQLARILPVTREILALRIKRLNEEVDVRRKRLDELRQEQLRKRREKDERELEQSLTRTTTALKELAEENKLLTDRTTTIVANGKQLSKELGDIKDQEIEIDRNFENLKHNMETLGRTASGIRLIEHRRGLTSTGKSRSRLSELNVMLQDSRTKLLNLKETRERLSASDELLQEITSSEQLQDLKNENERWKATEIAKRLIATQKEYVDQLIQEYDSRIEILSKLEGEHMALVAKVQEVKAFSDENALWVRSAEPIGISDVKKCGIGALKFFNRTGWQSLANIIGDRFKTRPYDAACLVLFVGILFVVQRRLRWSHD